MPIEDAQGGFKSCIDLLKAMCTLTVPDGKTVGEMNELEKIKARGSASVGGEGAMEDVLLEGEVSGGDRAETGTEFDVVSGRSAEGVSAASKAASDRSKVKVRWVTPNGRIQALRKEVEASRGLYEERKKMWHEAEPQ